MAPSRERPRQGIEVRPFEERDLSAVLSLQRAAFPPIAARPPGEVVRKLRALYLESPYCRDGLSHVAVEAGGEVVGFRGLLLRPWRLNGEPIRVATGTGVSIDPAWRRRGLASALVEAARERALALGVRPAFAVADRYTKVGLRFGTFVGDEPLPAYGFRWSLPARAGRLRSLLRRGHPTEHDAAPLELEALTASSFVESVAALAGSYPLHLSPDHDALGWLLGYLSSYPSRGRFEGRALHRGGQRVGFFAGHLTRGQFQILGSGALAPHEAAARRAVLTFSASLGARTLAGRATAWQLRPLLTLGARIAPDTPLGLALGRDPAHPEVAPLFQAGEALITGLEAETWI